MREQDVINAVIETAKARIRARLEEELDRFANQIVSEEALRAAGKVEVTLERVASSPYTQIVFHIKADK